MILFHFLRKKRKDSFKEYCNLGRRVIESSIFIRKLVNGISKLFEKYEKMLIVVCCQNKLDSPAINIQEVKWGMNMISSIEKSTR